MYFIQYSSYKNVKNEMKTLGSIHCCLFDIWFWRFELYKETYGMRHNKLSDKAFSRTHVK